MAQLVGRQPDLERAWSHLIAPGDGARAVFVEGPAGIGKTAFLDALATRASQSDAPHVGLAVSAAETAFPWAGVAMLLTGEMGARAADLPGPQRDALDRALGRAEGEVEPTIVASAVGSLLAAHLDRHRAVVLVLDDVHWLDPASAGAVAFAIRTNARGRLRVLVASRPGRRSLDPTRLLDASSTLRVELAGLAPESLQELLAERFGWQASGVDLRRLHDATGGNPLYALELGRHAQVGRAVDPDALPRSLDALIDEHLGALDPTASEVVAAAALLARPTRDLLARALGPVDDALLAAEDAGLVVVRGDTVSFAHPLFRAGVLHRIAGVRRRRLAVSLAAVVTDPDEHARLRADAAAAPDEEVAELLERAGEQAAARGAVHVAVERYRAALDLGDPHAPRVAQRHVGLARVLARAGDVGAAAEHYRAALAVGLPPAEEADAIALLAVSLHLAEGLDATLALLEPAAARTDLPPSARFRILSVLAYVVMPWDLRSAEHLLPRIVAAADASGEDALRREAEVVVARVGLLRGFPVDVDRLIARMGREVADATEPGRSAVVFLSELATWTDRRATAIEIESAEITRARASGHLPAESNALAFLADSLRREGRWDDALAAMRRWCEVLRLQGLEPTEEGDAAELAWLLAARGELAEARDLAAATVELTKSVRLWHMQALARSGFVALVGGDVAGAVHQLTYARDEAEEVGLDDLCSLPFRDDLVEALLLAGRLDDAAAEAERLAELAERSGRTRGRVAAARSAALVAAARGELEPAEQAVRSAVAAGDELGDPFEVARVLVVGGSVARRAGRRTDARERLDAARRRFVTLGAAGFLPRVDAELARLGERTGRPDRLTHTEQHVASLVATGRSNAETAAELFITPRTVEAHLTRVYRKLGVRSRAELIARREELGLG